MKIILTTNQDEITEVLYSKEDRDIFASTLSFSVFPKDFASAIMSDDYGDAKFATIEGLIKALKNYEE